VLHHLSEVPQAPERTVVIGSGGFVGSALMRALRSAGAPVLGLARKEIDLSAPDAAERLRTALKPGDAVVAIAARAPCKDMAMMIDNMVMTQTMIEALARLPVAHVVNISSDAVYADAPVPLSEESPTAPTGLHGAMHLARELAFKDTIKSPLAILRPTLLYGADDPHNGYGPNRFQRLANAGTDIVLFGEGEERRDHVLIEDVAEIILRVLKSRSTGVLNVASGEVHSFRKVAELVVAASPRKVAIRGSVRKGPMPHNGYRPFDIAATRAAFPDFVYTLLAKGIAKAQGDATARETPLPGTAGT
jgi:nucleoside-diphosphate-sugar epimerase